MNIFYSSEQDRQLLQLKKRRYQSILQYNKQEMDRKRRFRQQQQQQTKIHNLTINEEALQNIVIERKKQEERRQAQRRILKDSYERQMREREKRNQIEKQWEKQYEVKQKQHIAYEESKRIRELARIYNRVTYQGVPYPQNQLQASSRRRIKTQGREEGGYYSSSRRLNTADVGQEQERNKSFELRPSRRQPGIIVDTKWKEGQSEVKDSLDNLNAEDIRYPRKDSRNQY